MSIEREVRAESVRAFPLPHEAPRNANERRANGMISAHRAGYVKGYIAGASRPVTDEQADAAHVAFHEYAFGEDERLTARDLGVVRQTWKVALEAAREVGA